MRYAMDSRVAPLRPWLATLFVLLLGAPAMAADGVAPTPRDLTSTAALDRGLGVRTFALSGSHSSGTHSYQVIDSHGNGGGQAVGPFGERDVIVMLREPALSDTLRQYVRDARGTRIRGQGRLPAQVKAVFKGLEDDHRRFRESLRGLAGEVERSHPGAAARTQVRREYLRTFNGLALRAPASVVERLRRDPEVAAVYADTLVRAALEDSVPMIGAPTLWSEGITGAGVVVGIIDTGIDYRHPDLGGGFGPGFKVIGGYDFVNLDADPMDDAGHGTHVAGTVAGNGASKGVAPDAKLVAYKVLSAGGFGFTSDVIAAIERSADPDGDPTTDDALDVINLSLGGNGSPDDPGALAIDGVFDAGVLPVVAAGNSGPGYLTVGSPGCARKALTVGAVDKLGQMAWFSSRGPAPVSFGFKPDVVAPGVAIRSSVPSGGYEAYSGTSMATPHVAGAAALLLQHDPTLTPDALKSVLVTSARDLGVDRFVQGSGLIDVAAAARVTTTVDPPSVSFGLDDTRLPGFSGQATLTITNRAATSRVYAVSALTGGFPEGLTATVSPETISLGPGESGQLTLALTLDNGLVPKVPQPPFAYIGSVQVADAMDRLEVPFGILKGPKLQLRFDMEPYLVTVFGEQGRQWEYWFPGPSLDVLVPEGTYWMAASYDEYPASGPVRDFAVVREGLAVDTPYLVRRNEATHRVAFGVRDERGRELPPAEVGLLWTLRPEGSQAVLTGFSFGELYLSDVDERFHFDWVAQHTSPALLYAVSGHERGISSGLVLQNAPRDLKKVELDFDLDQPPEAYGLGAALLQSIDGNVVWFLTDFQQTAPPAQVIWGAFDSSPDANFLGVQVELRPTGDFLTWFGSEVVHQTAVLRPHGNVTDLMSTGSADPSWDPHRPLHTTRQTTFRVGLEPVSWFGKFRNEPDLVVLTSSLGGSPWLFVDQTMSLRAQKRLPFELYQGGTLVQQGALSGGSLGTWDRIAPIPVAPGRYTMKIRGPGDTIGGIAAQTLVSATFDTTAVDPNPPSISHFGITTAGGRPTKSVAFAHPALVQLDADDDVQLTSLRLSFRAGADGRWLPLPLDRHDGLYRTLLPTWFPPGAGGELPIALKIEAEDAQGNTLEHVLDPALTVSSSHAPRP